MPKDIDLNTAQDVDLALNTDPDYSVTHVYSAQMT